MTTGQIAKKITEKDGRAKWRIPVCDPFEGFETPLPVDPYLLGCWLGDGTSQYAAITTMDEQISQAFIDGGYDLTKYKHQNGGKAITYGVTGGMTADLRDMGLLNNKHVPDTYLSTMFESRLALLQGMMDTDGTVDNRHGALSFCTTSEAIRDGFMRLVWSLGGVCSASVKDTRFNISLKLPNGICAFRLVRKLKHIVPTTGRTGRSYNGKLEPRRFIKHIRQVMPRPTICYTVDAKDSLFCAGREMIVTHNTQTAVIDLIAYGLALTDGRARFLHITYSQQLAQLNSSASRDILSMDEFRDHWIVDCRDDTSAKGLWKTTERGGVRAASAGEPITGFRAGIMRPEDEEWSFTGAMIIDDPSKPDDALSQPKRDFVNGRYTGVFRSRLADEDVPVIIIQQRVHVDDFTAHLLSGASGDIWHHLVLPAVIDPVDKPPTYSHQILIDTGMSEGSLWDRKFPLPEMEKFKLDAYNWNSQYRQNPQALGGALFKEAMFKGMSGGDLPSLRYRFIIADTALTSKTTSDYSAFGHFGVAKDGRLILLEMLRFKLDVPEMETAAFAFWDKCKTYQSKYQGLEMGQLRSIGVENKASGTGLIQRFQRKGIPVESIEREKDKVARALDITPQLSVTPLWYLDDVDHLGQGQSWVTDWLNEMYAFTPDADGTDDQVDVTMDGVFKVMVRGTGMMDVL